MNARAKVHKRWDAELTKKLAPITWCERCGAADGSCGMLTKAHRKKRRFIGWRTEEDHQEYMMAAKLGLYCHQFYDENWNKENDPEFDAHQIMFDDITQMIRVREIVWDGA